jgi:hypothetical protein
MLNKMSSYVAAGQHQQYVLPFQMDAVPSSFKSNLAPRPINSVLQTVVVPSTSGTAAIGGTSTIQVPLGNSAYIANPYLRFRVNYVVGATAVVGACFKSSSQSAMALISSYQTSINSTLIDNIINFPQVADCVLSHSCSREWLNSDGNMLMATQSLIPAAAARSALQANLGLANDGAMDANATRSETYCIPLLGLLASQQAFPAWAINGVLQININWVSNILNALAGTAGVTVANLVPTFSDISLVYDRIAVEGDFIAKMKQDMASSGAKFTYSFTNYQTTSAQSVNGSATVNTGLNVSSLRGVVMESVLTADYTTADGALNAVTGYSRPMGLSNFQVTLDGRLVNSTILDATTNPAVVFQELQKTFSRCFDSSVTDNTSRGEFRGITADSVAATNGAKSFAVGVSCNRVAEGLAFQGSPVSVVGLNYSQAATTATNYVIYISDYSLLIGADGQCDIVR